jgi:plastocyanin
MKKSVLGITIAALAIGGIVAAVLANRSENDQPDSNTTQQTTSESSQQQESTTQNTEQTNQAPATESAAVAIEDFSFKPEKITVKKGGKVTWTNQDTAKHNVAPDDESGDFKAGPLLAKGESYSVTFNTVGTFRYHCDPHPNMTATVEVVE